MRACRWVDEVVHDAPWVITLDFLEKHNIDFGEPSQLYCLVPTMVRLITNILMRS